MRRNYWGGELDFRPPPAPIGRLGVHAPLAPILYYTLHFAPMLLGERTRFSPPPQIGPFEGQAPLAPPLYYTIQNYTTIRLRRSCWGADLISPLQSEVWGGRGVLSPFLNSNFIFL